MEAATDVNLSSGAANGVPYMLSDNLIPRSLNIPESCICDDKN